MIDSKAGKNRFEKLGFVIGANHFQHEPPLWLSAAICAEELLVNPGTASNQGLGPLPNTSPPNPMSAFGLMGHSVERFSNYGHGCVKINSIRPKFRDCPVFVKSFLFVLYRSKTILGILSVRSASVLGACQSAKSPVD